MGLFHMSSSFQGNYNVGHEKKQISWYMKKETNEKNLLWAQMMQSHHLGPGDVAPLGVVLAVIICHY
jgi:hypothetical protein